MGLSRHLWSLPRWARTALGVDDTTNVTEPPGGSKDTGYTALGGGTPRISRQFVNWLHREAAKGLIYVEDWFANHTNTANYLVRAGKAGGAGAASGTSGTTNTTEFEAVVEGASYVFPATAVSIPVQATLATMHRIIVGRVTAGVPSVVLVDGTVNATDPAIGSNEVAIHRARQNSGSATYNLDDLRIYGDLRVDRLHVDVDGQMGEAVFWGDVGSTFTFVLGESLSSAIGMQYDISQGGFFNAALWEFFSAVTRTTGVVGGNFNAVTGTATADTILNGNGRVMTATSTISYTIPTRPGERITGISGHFNFNNGSDEATISVSRVNLVTGARDNILAATGSPGAGNQTLTDNTPDVSFNTVTAGYAYQIDVECSAGTAWTFRGCEYTTTQSSPFPRD